MSHINRLPLRLSDLAVGFIFCCPNDSLQESITTFFVLATRTICVTSNLELVLKYNIEQQMFLLPLFSVHKRYTPPLTHTNTFLNLWSCIRPITAAAQSNAWIAFPRSKAEIVGCNLTQSMVVCLHFFCVCVVLCVGKRLCDGLITRPRSPIDCI
jgi:hypothetical protein